ncbi:MAG: hypothetical protein LBI67_09905 [Treponema sp.]|jgi:hypothetical protein|nr:hypothetical protein [Treponema sp.]
MTVPGRKLPVLVSALFFCATLPVGAQSFFDSLDYALRGSILFFPEQNGNASSPMPILPSLGASVSYPQSDLLAFELSLDLYGTLYDYSYELDRAVPASLEDRSSLVIGMLWGVQPVFRFKPLGENITVRGYGGLAFDLRICLLASGLDAGESHDLYSGKTVGDASAGIFSYFWGGGRWLFPFIGGGMDFAVLDGMTLGFDVRVWLPVWRVWTGENLPFLEGFRFGLGFRAAFR